MKIDLVEAYLIETRHPSYSWREGVSAFGGTSRDCWVRLVTDDGAEGWSPIDYWGDVAFETVKAYLAPLAIGKDPLARERLWEQVWDLDHIEHLPIYTIGALDVACWDITSTIAGLPLHTMIGGYRTAIPAYASTVTFGSVEEYLDVADQCLGLGFTAIKIHAWGDWRRDAELCQRVREHVGSDITLIYDGSAAFSYEDALRLGRVLEASDYLWFEEPMRESLPHRYRKLVDDLDIPVLATESTPYAHHSAAEYLRMGAADLVRTGTYYKAGITGSLRIAHVADAFGTTAEVHGPGPANIHLACGLANNRFYESLVDTNPVARHPDVDSQGLVHAPMGPGVGYALTGDEIRERAVAVHRVGAGE